jgi:hypothetical protein
MRRVLILACVVGAVACEGDDLGKLIGEGRVADSDGSTTLEDTTAADSGRVPPDTDTDDTPDWSPDDDSDGDGLTDGEEGRSDAGSVDTDGDTIPDYLDPDSDGDGVPDATEAGPREDDGAPADTDGDTIPDFRDTDSDADGILDADEAASTDGVPPDTDGDTVPDYRDGDSDGDGLTDLLEGSVDTDGDGTPDYRDLDSDGDSLLDSLERTADWDGDGIPNHLDPRNEGGVAPVDFTAITTAFNGPIGIDYHEHTGSVVLSVNYPTAVPFAFERVESDGSHVAFSSVSGLTDEVKIATARTNSGGFSAGELFVGNGVDGQIVRISADGSSVQNPWVDLPGDGNGLMRGSLYVDRTGVWGHDLLVATTAGELWRIDSAGITTAIADVGVHLEGLITVPDAPARYGPLAGKAIAGAEGVGLLYVFDTAGVVTTMSLGVNIEDIDIIEPFENFFGVNYGTSRLIGVPAHQFLPMAGDILLTQETVTSVGLFHLRFDGTDLVVEELTASSTSAALGQWEHVTTAAAGIQEVPE